MTVRIKYIFSQIIHLQEYSTICTLYPILAALLLLLLGKWACLTPHLQKGMNKGEILIRQQRGRNKEFKGG